MVSALNFQKSYHNMLNVFKNKNVKVMISPGCNAFRVLSDKRIGAHFKYFQIKTHVQTACESHDLNKAFHSFHLTMASNSFALRISCKNMCLTLNLLMSSADNLCKQFGPRSCLTKCRA